MPIRELTPELAQLAKDELGEVPSRIPADLQAIKDWLAKQRHIHARTGKNLSYLVINVASSYY